MLGVLEWFGGGRWPGLSPERTQRYLPVYAFVVRNSQIVWLDASLSRRTHARVQQGRLSPYLLPAAAPPLAHISPPTSRAGHGLPFVVLIMAFLSVSARPPFWLPQPGRFFAGVVAIHRGISLRFLVFRP